MKYRVIKEMPFFKVGDIINGMMGVNLNFNDCQNKAYPRGYTTESLLADGYLEEVKPPQSLAKKLSDFSTPKNWGESFWRDVAELAYQHMKSEGYVKASEVLKEIESFSCTNSEPKFVSMHKIREILTK